VKVKGFPATRRRPLPQTCLILFIGVAGSGKTRLAKSVLGNIWAVYLDNNHIVDSFFPDARNGKNYEKLRPHFYRALYTIAEENLRIENSVLLDVPHIKEIQIPEWRRFIKRMAVRTNAKLVVIRCVCSAELLRSRLLSRGEKRDRWKLAHWEEFLQEQPIYTFVPFAHLDINSEEDLLTNTRTAIRYIRKVSRD
jgi:predicted kinase